MLKFIPILALIFLVPLTAKAQTAIEEMPAGVYTLDKTHASLTWKVSHLGLSNYTARFKDFDATIDFKPDAVEDSVLTVTVNPASVETDYLYPEKKDFNKKLAESEKWFNSTEFPEITFTSNKLIRDLENANTGVIEGELNFLGQSHPLTLDVVFNGATKVHPFANVPAMGFSATTTLDRTLWELDIYAPNIGKDVTLLIEVEFHKTDE